MDLENPRVLLTAFSKDEPAPVPLKLPKDVAVNSCGERTMALNEVLEPHR